MLCFCQSASYQYTTVHSLLEDLSLLEKNAETFNGASSLIAADARSMVHSLRLALTHDRIHLGPDKDELTALENAIKRKYVEPSTECS